MKYLGNSKRKTESAVAVFVFFAKGTEMPFFFFFFFAQRIVLPLLIDRWQIFTVKDQQRENVLND